MKTIYAPIIVLWILSFSSPAIAAEEVKLFYRCYSMLSGLTPGYEHPQLVAVKNGQKTAAQACVELLNSTKFGSNGRVNAGDPEQVAVLNTMHQLHSTWFTGRNIQTGTAAARFVTMIEFFDSTAPAMHFTAALFDPQVNFTRILRGNGLYGLRSEGADDSKTRYISYQGAKLTPADTVFDRFDLVEYGDLQGIKVDDRPNLNWTYDGRTGQVNLRAAYGSGVIGHPIFVGQIVGDIDPPDGGEKMIRKWSRDLFSDLMCRELPMVRESDARRYVDASADVSFRQSVNCVICHATMDQAAAAGRHFFTQRIGSTRPPHRGLAIIRQRQATLGGSQIWRTSPDEEYAKRPANGKLYYRDYQGRLINTPVEGVQELADAILQQDDVYICAAKRYYEYFTGVVVDTSDPAGKEFSPASAAHRSYVIQLGIALKNHKDPSRTIADILGSPSFKGENP